MNMQQWSNNLFYLVFLGQIFLISYYFPKKLLGRMRYVLDNYPPSAYPKLYPRPVEHYKIAHWSFKVINRSIVILGFVILFAVMFLVDHSTFADDGFISEAWPAGYGLIQFLPLMVLEFSEFGHLKLMRKTNSTSIRKADMHRRGLFDLVPPTLLVLTVLLYFGTIVLDLYVHDFVVAWDHDTVQRAIVLTGTNLLLAAVGAWNLFGRKQDPYQSSEDRSRRISANIKSMLYVSMAMSIYFMTVVADDAHSLDFIDATLLSAYFQVIAFLSIGPSLRSARLEDINFDVYKNDAPVT